MKPHLVTKALLGATLLLVALATITSAQGARPDTVLRRAQLESWYVRATADHEVLGEGLIREFRSDSVRLGFRRVAVVDVIGLERRIRVGGGAKGGAAVGAMALGTLGFGMALGFCEYGCLADAMIASSLSALLGGLTGALAGELLRPAKHEWKRVWP